MKALCENAGVQSSKVFPHNLRHLFATTFYRATRDIGKLPIGNGEGYVRQLDRLGLIS